MKFKIASADILPGKESEEVLQGVLDVLKEHSEITKVRVEGHTDNIGGAKFNLTLSQRRAASVRRYLIEHGVEAERLLSEGYGGQNHLSIDQFVSDGLRLTGIEFDAKTVRVTGEAQGTARALVRKLALQ